MKDKPLFGDVMAKKVYDRGISLRKFGKIMGISDRSILYYANSDRIPAANVFLRICEELEIDPNSVRFKTKEN